MKTIQRVLFLVIFLLSSAGLFSSSSYAFNKLDDEPDQDGSATKSKDTFEDLIIISEFFKELSQLGKDQLKPSVKEIEATAEEPSKLEITLTIGPALGKVLEKYLNYQEGTKVTIGSVSKKFSSKYTKGEIEKRMKTMITQFIVVVLETKLLSDQEKVLEKAILDIIEPLLKENEFLKYIKESIVGTIPEAVPESFDPKTLINYLFLKDVTAQGFLTEPQKLLEHLKTLIVEENFKIDPLPASFISDKEITYKITYLKYSLQAKITCDATEYYFENQCMTEADCKKKGYLVSIENGKNVCGPCPVDQGTHKINENNECVNNTIEDKYNAKLVQIMESYCKELQNQYNENNTYVLLDLNLEPEVGTQKAAISLKFSNIGLDTKYYYNLFEGGTIELYDETEMTYSYSDIIEREQYAKEKVVEFLEKLLDRDSETLQLVKENPLLQAIVNRYVPELPEVAPDNFNSKTPFDSTKHNVWQAIYLTEVKSFIGENETEIKKPDTYTKATMTPYLKALLKDYHKWAYIKLSVSYDTEIVEKCEAGKNSYFYNNNQCITKATCEGEGLFAYIDDQGKLQCGSCPATHLVREDGVCALQATECTGIQGYFDNGFCIDKITCEEKGLSVYMDTNGKNQCSECPVTHRVRDEDGICALQATECTGTQGYFDNGFCISKEICKEKGRDTYIDQAKNICGSCPKITHTEIDGECVPIPKS